MFEFVGVLTAFAVIAFIILAVLVSLAAPIAWIWMLIDAILREDAEYPGTYENARLVWVLLIAFLPVTAVVYFFAVYVKARRATTQRNAELVAATPAAPSCSTPAPAAS